MTTCAEYATQLAAVQAVLNNAVLGGVVKSTRYGEKQVEFSATSINDLRIRERELQARVDACNGVTRGNRVLRFVPSDG